MNDINFLSLLTEENLAKIDIDERLIEPFKLAMTKLQEFFDANGFSEKVNFSNFLKAEYFDDYKKFKICISNELPESVGGSHTFKVIKINEKILQYNIEEIAHTICHEFIHFLVHEKTKLGSHWAGEVFVDEAFTEHLASAIFPNTELKGYGPIPSLMSLFNKLSGYKENYFQFITQRPPTQDLIRKGFFPDSFSLLGNECMKKYQMGLYANKGYEIDIDYINIQRDIINTCCKKDFDSFEELQELIILIDERPVTDEEWIINFILEKSKLLINNQPDIEKNITLYIKQFCELRKYDKEVFEFYIGKQLMYYDGTSVFSNEDTDNLDYHFINETVVKMWNKNNESDNFTLDFNQIDLNARTRNIYQKINDIREILQAQIKPLSKK